MENDAPKLAAPLAAPLAAVAGEWLPAEANKTALVPARVVRAAELSDMVALLLADKRSPATRRNYDTDLRYFFTYLAQGEPTPRIVEEFLSWPPPKIATALTLWKGSMLQNGLSENTVNRRLSAAKSLLKLAHRHGRCATDGRNLVDGEKVISYRDTRGITLPQLKRLLREPARQHGATTVRGLRDTAILMVLSENVLRRNEAHLLDVKNFSLAECSLQLLRKGSGTQKRRVTVSNRTAQMIAYYLQIAGHALSDQPLFLSMDRNPKFAGRRLTASGIYKMVCAYGRVIDEPTLTPHKLRHTGITIALDAGMDIREVRKLSGHAKFETLLIYDDNRADLQGKVTNALSDLFAEVTPRRKRK